jgi:RNA polymerase sigma-70 factor (ECF subfamily)
MNPGRQEQAYQTRSVATSSPEDVALVRRMADGDEASLAAFYDRWVQPVYSLVVALLRDADEAEDVVEEAFWQAWQRAGTYDESRGTVRTWLLTIGRSRALDRLRSRQRHPDDTNEIGALPDTAPDPLLDAIGTERRELVQRALAELPDDQRLALELAYFGGMSQSEIAAYLEEPLGTIKTRMRLALQKLRNALVVLGEARA